MDVYTTLLIISSGLALVALLSASFAGVMCYQFRKTGRSDMESVVEAKSSGVTAYIRKPFSPKQLEAKLRIILYKMAA